MNRTTTLKSNLRSNNGSKLRPVSRLEGALSPKPKNTRSNKNDKRVHVKSESANNTPKKSKQLKTQSPSPQKTEEPQAQDTKESKEVEQEEVEAEEGDKKETEETEVKKEEEKPQETKEKQTKKRRRC